MLVIHPKSSKELNRVLFNETYEHLPFGPLPRDYTAQGEYHWHREAQTYPWMEATNRMGWGQYRPQPNFRVVDEDGDLFMEHSLYLEKQKGDSQLNVGDTRWTDYQVTTRMRLFSRINGAGVTFRYRTSRCHYAWLLEGEAMRLVLRVDDDVRELASAEYEPDFDRYRAMVVECEGDRLRCFLDGKLVMEAHDDTLPTGKIGLIATHMARWGPVSVRTNSKASRAYVNTMSQESREIEEARERLPKPQLWKRFKTPEFGAGKAFRFGDLNGDGRLEAVVVQNGRRFANDGRAALPTCVTAVTLEGEVLWQLGRPYRGDALLSWDICIQIHDIDGDGAQEVVLTKDFEIVVLEGATGRCKMRAPTPRTRKTTRGPRQDLTERIDGDCLYFCDLTGRGAPRDFVIKDRYNHAWGYSAELEELWHVACDTGHYPYAYDVDGDGRDEIMIGYTLLNPDGSVRWSHDFDDHADSIAMAPIGPEGEERIVLACGDAGVYFLDMEGKILRHDNPGHAQCGNLVKLRDDVPGLQVATITYWYDPGILVIYDWEGNRLHSSEPINVGSHLNPTNWSGDGVEHLLLNTDAQRGGLLDGRGRAVVQIPDDGHPVLCCEALDLTGDARDEIVTWDQDEVWIYTQDRPAETERIYAPKRPPLYNESNYRAQISLPAWE